MIIKSFSARKVHGHYDFNFEFFKDVTFLVGINGTGKTSALRLMQAALSIDLYTLLSIKFSSLKIEVENENSEYTLNILRKSDQLLFSLNGRELTFDISPLIDDETKIFNPQMEEHLEALRFQLIKSGNEIFGHFTSGVRPLFLGLERRMGRYDYEPYAFDMTIRPANRGTIRHKRETLDGLENCQRLVERAYKQYRRISDGSIDRLLNIIIESTFEYIDFDFDSLKPNDINPREELEEFQKRRQEIENFARKLSGSEKVTAQVEKFFLQLSEALNKYKDRNEEHFSLEWLMNLAQVQRIRKILAEIDRQKKTAEKFYAPIKEFEDSMNRFLKHSRKDLHIDPLGKIRISQLGNPIDISLLSSGEKQLLILMTHARFGFNKKSTFIVDEPELSLHMRWQEMLIGALLEGNKNNQFIFATHSPEIVGYLTNHCIQVG